MSSSEAFEHNKTYDKCDLTTSILAKGDYEFCTFNSCNFSNTVLSDFKFIDCQFMSCNLSLVKLHKTMFQNIKFQDCKMLGLRFDQCAPFGLSFSFQNCQLNHSTFYKTKLKKTLFKNCQLLEVDFAESDLTQATFDQCDLLNANFEHTILEFVDFRTAYNFNIDLELNRIKKAMFSLNNISGLLSKYNIEIS